MVKMNQCIRGMNYIPDTELIVEKTEITVPKYDVIDAHAHFGKLVLGDDYEKLYDMDDIISILKGYHIKKIVNLDGFWVDELGRMLEKTHPYNDDFIINFGGVDISRLDEPGFDKYIEKTLSESVKKGIKGIKVWKNVSLEMKDSKGKKIPIDDDRLRIIWETAAKFNLVVLAHIADPLKGKLGDYL